MRCQGEFSLPFQAVQREINRSMGFHPERFGLGNAERCQLQPVKVTVHSGTDLERRRREALAELFGYATAIRSLSRGRASYSMQPEQFAIVPRAVKEAILNR